MRKKLFSSSKSQLFWMMSYRTGSRDDSTRLRWHWRDSRWALWWCLQVPQLNKAQQGSGDSEHTHFLKLDSQVHLQQVLLCATSPRISCQRLWGTARAGKDAGVAPAINRTTLAFLSLLLFCSPWAQCSLPAAHGVWRAAGMVRPPASWCYAALQGIVNTLRPLDERSKNVIIIAKAKHINTFLMGNAFRFT